jgi:hypothetical protein
VNRGSTDGGNDDGYSILNTRPPELLPSSSRHESAHAVVACRLGLPLRMVHIRREKVGAVTFGGACRVAAFSKRRRGDTLRARAIHAAAGILCERACGRPDAELRASSDVRAVRRYGSRLAAPDPALFLEECVAEADRLLWLDDADAWLAVAKALRSCGQLTGRQVRALVHGKVAGTLFLR